MSVLVQRSDVGEFRRRYRWLVIAVFLAFGVLAVKLVTLQLVEVDVHRAQARRNITGEIRLATTRGVVRDALGKVLAANRPSYNVYVVPSDLDLKATWPLVSQLMALADNEKEELGAKITEAQNNPARRDQQVLLKVDVDRNVVASLKTHEAELPGVQVVPVPVRY